MSWGEGCTGLAWWETGDPYTAGDPHICSGDPKTHSGDPRTRTDSGRSCHGSTGSNSCGSYSSLRYSCRAQYSVN